MEVNPQNTHFLCVGCHNPEATPNVSSANFWSSKRLHFVDTLQGFVNPKAHNLSLNVLIITLFEFWVVPLGALEFPAG